MKKLSYLLIAPLALFTISSCHKADNNYTAPTYYYSFDDEMNDNTNNWAFIDNSNNASVYIGNGLLQYSYHPVNPGTNTVAIPTGINFNSNFIIQTKIMSNNAMGLVFGVSNSQYGYSFFIDNNGNFAVYNEGSSNVQAVPIINWTSNAAIRSGWNSLELDQINGYWNGYINGTRVFRYSHDNYMALKLVLKCLTTPTDMPTTYQNNGSITSYKKKKPLCLRIGAFLSSYK